MSLKVSDDSAITAKEVIWNGLLPLPASDECWKRWRLCVSSLNAAVQVCDRQAQSGRAARPDGYSRCGSSDARAARDHSGLSPLSVFRAPRCQAAGRAASQSDLHGDVKTSAGRSKGLRDCRLPVALQAFAQTADAFPKGWSPLSVVAPLTEFSAEFQAIAYALENPSTELVFVDRAVDYVFQWMPQKEDELGEKHMVKGRARPNDPKAPGEEEDGDVPDHGAAIGLQMGKRRARPSMSS